MSGPGSFTESGRSYLVGPLEARKGGEGGSAVRGCSAAAMAWAAAFRGARSGGGARFGMERGGEEREREVARQNGEKRAAEGSSAGEELRAGALAWAVARRVAVVAECQHSSVAQRGRRALECGAGSTVGEGRVLAWPGGEQ